MELDLLLSQMAREVADLDTRQETIDAVTQYARVAVGADDAGVMLVHGRRVETPAGTSADVTRAHELQAELGEGPCLAALAGGDQIYVVTDARHDERWPAWGKAAADLGYHSVVSASLETDSHRIGSLNVYARTPDFFDVGDADVVGLLSGHATAALAAAKMQQELRAALGSRMTIGQAQGILMHAYDIDSDRAFAYLRRISQDQNIKLVDVAEAIIENGPTLGPSRSPEIVRQVTERIT
jgi:GAF domain-containing protein